MHITSRPISISLLDDQDGTRASINIPPDELIHLGTADQVYYICLRDEVNKS